MCMAPKFFQFVLVALVRSEMASTTARACDVVVLSSMCLWGLWDPGTASDTAVVSAGVSQLLHWDAYSRVIHYHLRWPSTPALQ